MHHSYLVGLHIDSFIMALRDANLHLRSSMAQHKAQTVCKLHTHTLNSASWHYGNLSSIFMLKEILLNVKKYVYSSAYKSLVLTVFAKHYNCCCWSTCRCLKTCFVLHYHSVLYHTTPSCSISEHTHLRSKRIYLHLSHSTSLWLRTKVYTKHKAAFTILYTSDTSVSELFFMTEMHIYSLFCSRLYLVASIYNILLLLIYTEMPVGL